MTRADRIAAALKEALQPEALTVIDESEHHHGHGGWREGGETHYRIEIVSAAFAGKTRVAAHRMVNDLLKGEFETGLHALAIDARTH